MVACCGRAAVIAARQIGALRDDEGAHDHLNSLAQAAFADAAQAAELEAIGSHQQVLRHGHIQVGTLQLLCTKPTLQDYWASPCICMRADAFINDLASGGQTWGRPARGLCKGRLSIPLAAHQCRRSAGEP